MGSGVHCKQCGKELEGMDQYSYPYMCSACRHAEEVRKQGEEAREWRQRQEWEDMERAREQRKHEREQRQWEEEQAEKDRKLRERELKDQEQQRKLAEEQRHEEISYNKALPKCKWCGKQYTFAPDSNSFYEYCSKKCAIEELGKDKADEYASGGLQLIMQQISNAFADEENIHKAIVLSEGFSQLFSVQQHISIANAIKTHRKYFLSTDELNRTINKHYQDAFCKANRNQQLEIICSALSPLISLEGETLTDCHLPLDCLFLSCLMAFFSTYKEISSNEVAIFEHLFTFLTEDVLKGLYNLEISHKLPHLLSLIDKEETRREEKRKRQEEEEEERKRQNKIRTEIQVLKKEKQKIEEKQKKAGQAMTVFHVSLVLCIVLFGCVLVRVMQDGDSDGPVILGLASLSLGLPLLLLWNMGHIGEKDKEKNKNRIIELEQKIKEMSKGLG